MPKPKNLPEDPPRCDACGKVKGAFKGWLGAECMCGVVDYEKAAKRAHSVGRGRR